MSTVGLVGCGAWGKNILRDLVKLRCTVFVADVDPRVEARALAQGASGFRPSAAELPSCDGYVVAVPIPDLTPVCLGLLKHGKPVFSEKTLCRSMADHARLARAGGDALVHCMHKWHYHPGIEALRVVACSGRLGPVREVVSTRHAWVPDFHGGDVFWTQSVHDLTIVKHLVGRIPTQVRAIHVIEDGLGLPVAFSAILGSTPAVVLSVSGRHCSRVSGVSIHGPRGTAELADALDDHLTVKTDAGDESVPIDTTYPLFLELQEFVGYLQGGPRPRCGLKSAREVTQAILRLRRAAGLRP